MVLRKQFDEKVLNRQHLVIVLGMFPLAFFIFALLVGDNILEGLKTILISPTILITDFLALGGVGAAFLNAAIIGFVNILFLKKFKMKINGLLIAAFMTMIGFAFLGKNLVNIIPLYIGGFLYARSQQIHMRDVIAIIMFSTGLSPIISEIMFAGLFPASWGYVLGFGIGIFIGFVIAPLSAHMIKFHDGYNLYNIGFTAGIVGTFFTSILRALDKEIEPVSILYAESDTQIKILLIVLFLGLIILGFYVNKKALSQYTYVFKYSGRTVTDFPFLVGNGITFVNMGLMGILSIATVAAFGGVINGPIMASVFTIVGFAALGKHPKNCLPIMIGVITCGVLLGIDLSGTSFLMAVLFSTTLAPIAGKYGPVVGFVSGMLHLTLVMNIGIIHGGINLYNNGFSGGIVASFVVPIIDAFKKGK